MTSGGPWQAKGVRREVIDSAREAARRSGMSVTEWLDIVISESAKDAGVPPVRRSAPSGPLAPTDSVHPNPGHASESRPESPSRRRHSDFDEHPRHGPAPQSDIAGINSKLEQLSRRLDELTHASATQQHSDDARHTISEALSQLDRKIERLAGQNRHANSTIERPVGTDRGIRHSEQSFTGEPAAGSKAPLEQALSEIEARQRALDGEAPPARMEFPRAPNQRLPDLEQELRQINARIEAMRPCGLDSAVETLRDDLAEIGLMLKDAMPRRAIEALESEVRSLSARIDSKRHNGADSAAVAAIERGLAEVRDALHALAPAERLAGFEDAVESLSQKIDRLASSGQDPAALKQLEGAIVALRGVVSQVASDDALTNLSEEVRRLSAKVDHVTSSDTFSAIEQRISLIAQALESRGNPTAQGGDVDAIVHGLSEKIDRLALQPRSEAGAETRELEGIVHSLAEKIEGLALQQRSSLDARELETVLEKLSEQVERLAMQAHSATDTRELEAVVSRLAAQIDRFVRQANSTDTRELQAIVNGLSDKVERLFATSVDQSVVSQLEDRIVSLIEKLEASRLDHLESIERGLSDLLTQIANERAGAVERTALETEADALKRGVERTQDSLEALHGTLGHLADRLATIESSLRPNQLVRSAHISDTAAAPAAQSVFTAPDMAPAVATGSISDAVKPGRTEAAPPLAPISPSPASERRPIDPNLPPDHPLEPGISRARSTPSERIAASEAALENVRPPVIPDPGGKSNFIAAARRAAQAAMVEAPVLKDKPAPTSTNAPATGTHGGKVRKVLVGLGLILFVLGALHLVVSKVWSARPIEPQAQTAREHGPPTPTNEEPPLPARTDPDRQSVAPPGMLWPNTVAPAPLTFDREATGSIRQPGAVSALAPLAPPAASARTTDDPLPAGIGGGLRAAALKGDPTAEFEVAMRFAEARGVPQDLAEAVVWFERAAAKGLAPAHFRLGGLYEKGLGVRKNLDTARRHYLIAAEAGNAKAMHNLAVIYAEGVDGKPDYQSAARWFRKAADHGVIDSQYNLAILYARGIGVEINLTESFKWFALASREGDREAIRKRDDVAGRLDKTALTAAMTAAQAWQQQPQPDAAVNVPVPNGGWDSVSAPSSAKRSVGNKRDTPSR